MKFIVNSQLIHTHLQALSGVLTTNNTVPIISCFHFQLGEGKLTITATDLNTTLQTYIEVDTGNVGEVNAVAVPSKMLLETIKLLGDVPLTFDINESNFAIEISTGENRYNLAGLNAETFPSMPKKAETKSVVISSDILTYAISKTAFAAGIEDELHRAMSGVLCEITTEGIGFVATDAHKLVRYKRKDISIEEETNLVLPRKPITMVKNILGTYKEGIEVTLDYDTTNIFFTFDNFFIACRLIDAKYPNYSAAIPKQNPNVLTLERVDFLAALRRVSLFANKSTNQVRLSINNTELTMSAEDLELSNNAQEKMNCNYVGEPMEIGFNAKFLTEMVSNIESESIRLEMSHPSRAGLIIPETMNENEDLLMLVMPVMLANN